MLLSASLSGQPTPDSTADAASRTAHLEGQVLSQAGEPLRKASVRLTPNAERSSNPVYYTDTTDGAGKFILEGVLPGRYTLSAEHTGFLSQNYGARGATAASPGLVLTLAAGQIMKDLNFKLIPRGVITGRVMDADGDPMPGLDVWVSSLTRFRGERQLLFAGRGARTDDQGSFRIANLSPGTYYVSANDTQPRVRPQEIAGRPGRVLNRDSSVITYYPDSVDAAGATGLQILAGSELHGIDIRLRQERVFSIRGLTIDAATGKPATTNLIARLKGGSLNGFGLPWQTSSREDGTFELHNLLPGEYVIMASTNAAEPATGREEVSVSDSDITGVKLTLAKGATVTGTVKLEGDGPPVRPTIVLADLERAAFGNASNAQAEDDGTFALHGVMPVKYAAFVDALPEGVYVKDPVRAARCDAHDA
jgi:Carboxypeptidase regulatory-like domain